MPAVHEYTYFVTGTGEFPIDMLRYDCAWPAHENDAGHIEKTFFPRERGRWNVMVKSHRQPTLARWRSFDCAVGEVNERRL